MDNNPKKIKGMLLPNYTTLCAIGYGGLPLVIRKYPDRFSHIPQERNFKRVEEWITIAEKMAEKNDGILPHGGWLIKNNKVGLVRCMYKHPEKFKHIPQHKVTGNPPRYWVAIAEDLAKKHNGVLPNMKWLNQNGYRALVGCIINHREFFRHIPQKNLFKSVEYWISIAEKLSTENNGILPDYSWLRKNGYSGVCRVLSLYPKRCRHIKQQRLQTEMDEWIKIAEKLAKKHKGILPQNSWMDENGYIKLRRYICKHAERFSHIPREMVHKESDFHIKEAEQLAKQNGGIVPSYSWLTKHGFYALAQHMIKYRDRYQHLKQENKKGMPLSEAVKIAEQLARQNGGVLPNRNYLREKKMLSVINHLKKHPSMFNHIPKEKLRKDLNDHLKTAKILVENNNGILPCRAWMKINGYSDLDAYIAERPEKFHGIKREFFSGMTKKVRLIA